MLLGSVALFLTAILFAGSPLLAMAQQTGTTTTTTTTIPSPTAPTTAPAPSPPLTPEEQEEQARLQNVIAATNQNLDEAEKEVNGIVYTPRWSNPVWIEANSLAVLIAYCLPGEFAESGQEILGGFELEVLESYEIALAQGFMAWMMVIGNEDRQDRLPAAVGVICASDTNEVETRVLSPQEQQQINNVVQQFITTTQVTNIEQVINIINNVTTNGTGTTTPPPPPPPTGNNTGTPPTGNNTGGGPFRPTTIPGVVGNITVAQIESPRVEIISSGTEGVAPATFGFEIIVNEDSGPHTWLFEWGDGFYSGASNCHLYKPGCQQELHQEYEHTYTRAGTYNVVLKVWADGGYASDSIVITVEPRGPPGGVTGGTPLPPREQLEGVPPPPAEEEEAPPVEEEEQPPTDEEEEAPPVEEEQATEQEEATTTSPPANEGGGG